MNMKKLNHFAISSILNSEIVGRGKFGQGQIESLGDAQHYFDMLATDESPAIAHEGESVDLEVIVKAFHAVRNRRGDRGSPDLYVADPERNAVYLAKCRELGLQVSDYTLNKALLYVRKNNCLPNLKSIKTSIDYDEFAFASEFAATELKYKTGATIDDILCDPGLAARFDSIAKRLSPGFTSFQYRWAILSIRKKERRKKLPTSFHMPEFTGRFRLVVDPVDQLPDGSGVYQLFENQRLLYVRSTEHLRHGIELHRAAVTLRAITEKLWETKPEDFMVSYAVFEDTDMLRPVEEKIVEEKKPIFNVPRSAA
jgi:site-specific DNA-methyltransferase (adenine-specific)